MTSHRVATVVAERRTIDRRANARRRSRALVAWLVLTLAGLGLCLTGWADVGTPTWLPYVGAIVITSTYAYGLANRTGGPALGAGVLLGAIATTAVITEEPVLLSGITVAAAAEVAVFAMLLTRPAARFLGVVRELVVAILVAAVGAFAVEAYQAPIAVSRATYLALAVALLGSFGLAWRLGAGFAGLGRRGAAAVALAVLLLTVGLAYTEALSRWGAADLTDRFTEMLDFLHDRLGALPRPTAYLLGFPALIWGVYVRARRRQGWWVCAFGAAGLVIVATSLLDPGFALSETGVSLAYTTVLGVIIGYLVVRADIYLSGTRGRRARELEAQAAHRPEPGRTRPLL